MARTRTDRQLALVKAHRHDLIKARAAYGSNPMDLFFDEDAIVSGVEATSIVRPHGDDQNDVAALVAEGMDGIGKIEAGRPVEQLTPRELAGAEAIVLLFHRPALLVSNGTFIGEPESWMVLDQHRSEIDHSIAAVGRIDVNGHPELDWIGTGFLVADDVVMTARHVVAEFASNSGNERWTIAPEIKPSIDFLAEKTSIAESRYFITDVIAVHSTYDLALLRLGGAADPTTVKPSPLKLAAAADPKRGDVVYVVGYPSMDSRRNEPAEMQRIFRRIYDVKRLQPGTVVGNFPDRGKLLHDCSTLGGNSGSCVVSLDTHQVVGLHYAGRYSIANNAVNLSALRNDPILASLAIS